MAYENDNIARYLAMRVLQNRNDPNTGMTYERAITSAKTKKEAINWWIEELNKTV